MSKVRVYGKAQSRTALGIFAAYLKMYPQATLEDLNKAFPSKEFFAADKNGNYKDTLISVSKELKSKDLTQRSIDYLKSDYYYKLNDGSKFTLNMCYMWTKESFPKLVEYAKIYDIEVAEFTEAEKGFGKKGTWRLEYLNGYIPPVADKKKMPWWIWVIIGAAFLILFILLMMRSCGKSDNVVVVHDTTTVTKVDTVYAGKMLAIQNKFNATQFTAGKADLNDDAKEVLIEVVYLLKNYPNVRMKVVGHTSEEGGAAYNQKLSEKRAKAVADYIISKGIDKSRVQSEGKGSSEPKDPNNREVNRRTEFIVIK